MGQAKSKSQNTVESTTDIFYGIVNQTLQNCSQTVNQDQIVNIEQGAGSIIEGSNISQKQLSILDTKCAQSSSTKTDLQNSLNKAAEQQANAINSSMGLPAGSAKANNITKYVTDIATSITNAYSQTCSATIANAQRANIKQGDGSIIRNFTLDQEQVTQNMLNCIQNSESVTQATTNLQEAVDQTSKSETTGIPTAWIIGIVIGIVVIALIIGLVIFFIARTVGKTAQTGIQTLGAGQQMLIGTAGDVLTNPEFAKTVSSVGEIAGPIALGAATGGTSTALSSIAGPLLGAVSGWSKNHSWSKVQFVI